MNKNYSITLIALGAAFNRSLSIAISDCFGTHSYHTSNIGNRLNCYTFIALKKQLFPFYFTFIRSNWSTSFLWWQWWSSRPLLD